MTTYHEIYARPLADDYDLIADLEAVLGVPFNRTRVGDFVAKAAIDGKAAVDVIADMKLEDLPDMPFETHPWMITIRNLDNDKDEERKLAEPLFDGLKATGRYSLFLTLDGQVLLKSAIVEQRLPWPWRPSWS